MVNRLGNEVEFVDQIVRDLYRENFSVFERTYQKSEQYIKVLNRIDKLADKLNEILPFYTTACNGGAKQMSKIISDIYRGNYTPFNHRNRKGTPFAKTLDQINELEEQIRKALPESLKESFDQLLCARNELTDMACEENFEAGYQLAIRMILAGLEGKEMSSQTDSTTE